MNPTRPYVYPSQTRAWRHPGSRFSTFLLTLFLLCSVALETNAAPVSDDGHSKDFLEQAETIFQGRLISTESFRDANGLILTRHLFRIEGTLKGSAGKTFTITEYGGTVGNLRMEVTHSPRYFVGQRYLVFTYRDLLGHHRTLSGTEGALPILLGSDGIEGVRLFPSHPISTRLEPKPFFRPLDQFRQQISALIEEGAR